MSLFISFAILFGAIEALARVAVHLNGKAKWWGAYRAAGPKLNSFVPHPYALYVKRPNADGLYPSNSLGYAGKREITSRRSGRAVRIYCVGGSTTEEHRPLEDPNASWPFRVQDLLGKRFPGVDVECINAGTSAYTTAESMIEFLLRGIDLRPDLLLVYHNVNDAWTCQMVEGFKADYSHARLHMPWTPGWTNRLPQCSWIFSYQVVRLWAARRYGKRNALLHWVSNVPWRATTDVRPEAVDAFRRNLITLAAAARAWSCVPVLVKWECDWSAEGEYCPPYLLGDRAANSRVFYQFLKSNNRAIADAAAHVDGCHYVDVGPFASEHFDDKVHFSAAGITEMARRTADRLAPILSDILARKEVAFTARV